MTRRNTHEKIFDRRQISRKMAGEWTDRERELAALFSEGAAPAGSDPQLFNRFSRMPDMELLE